MDTTIEAAKAFCHHGKSAFAFDPIVLKHMAEFSDAQNARLVSELETAKRALTEIQGRYLVFPNNRTKEQMRQEAATYCRAIREVAQAALKGKE